MRKFLFKMVPMMLLLCNSYQASATGLFADVAYVGSSVKIAEQEFKPTLLQLGIGWQFTDRFSVALYSAASQSSDMVTTVEADIPTMNSLIMRYGSPVSSTANVYVMLGHTDLNLTMQGVTVQSDENFAGTSWGFGFEERLNPGSNFRLHFDYIVHYNVDELEVESYQLGLRYAF